VPTDPYVPVTLDEIPRQEQNLPPGVKVPPARPWQADRPGDLSGQPSGSLLGDPGPNVGYAMKLARRVADQLVLGEHEHRADAVDVAAEVAMKRAASYGRAPVPADIEVAVALLGYRGGASPEFVDWRVRAVQGAAHHYRERRRIVDAIPIDVLRLIPERAAAGAAAVQETLRTAVAVN
jgi:hypothetical protein